VPYHSRSCLPRWLCRDGAAHAPAGGAAAAAGERAPPLSLDRFCATHTSEDNASFALILAASNKRRRVSQPWLFEDKNEVSRQQPRRLQHMACKRCALNWLCCVGAYRLDSGGRLCLVAPGLSAHDCISMKPELWAQRGAARVRDVADQGAGASAMLTVWSRQVPRLEAARDRSNDGFGTTFQPQHEMALVPFTAKNALYYDSSERAAVALTDAERSQLVQARSSPARPARS